MLLFSAIKIFCRMFFHLLKVLSSALWRVIHPQEAAPNL